mgnify:CR=1 FL=1
MKCEWCGEDALAGSRYCFGEVVFWWNTGKPMRPKGELKCIFAGCEGALVSVEKCVCESHASAIVPGTQQPLFSEGARRVTAFDLQAMLAGKTLEEVKELREAMRRQIYEEIKALHEREGLGPIGSYEEYLAEAKKFAERNGRQYPALDAHFLG